jgi:hypothetical protein
LIAILGRFLIEIVDDDEDDEVGEGDKTLLLLLLLAVVLLLVKFEFIRLLTFKLVNND